MHFFRFFYFCSRNSLREVASTSHDVLLRAYALHQWRMSPSIIRNTLCIINYFLLFFSKITLCCKLFLIAAIHFTTWGPLCTCLLLLTSLITLLYFLKMQSGCAKQTSVDWTSFCREVCEMVAVHRSGQIGGPGKICAGTVLQLLLRKDSRWSFIVLLLLGPYH